MEIKTQEDLKKLFQEYKHAENNILKEIYQILIYSNNVSREDLFLMTRQEKDILIQVMKEKIEQENKANGK